MSLVKVATKYLLKYNYKKVNSKHVYDIIEKFPAVSVNELIRIFFKDKHTFHDSYTDTPKLSDFPKPNIKVTKSKNKIVIQLDSFVGIFVNTNYKKKYIDTCQSVLKDTDHSKTLVIDLRNDQGGSDKVMFEALRGIGKWKPGLVLVGKKTASAGEMITNSRNKVVTAGALSIAKNIVLSDGSFLSIRTLYYTRRIYL